MNNLLPEFVDPYEEWYIVAKELVRRDKDATLWDLIKCMYEYKTSCEIPDFPDENKVIGLHMRGWPKVKIAEELSCKTNTINFILDNMGFKGFRKEPKYSPFEVEDMLSDECAKNELDSMSSYLFSRCLEELKVYKEYVNGKG